MSANTGKTKISISLLPADRKEPINPYALYEEKCTELHKIMDKKDTASIIAEVDPKANVYTLPVAVIRLDTIVRIAATGMLQPSFLLKIVKNHQEDIAWQAVREAAFSPSEAMYQLHRMAVDELDKGEKT